MRDVSENHVNRHEGIAIIGMSCLFPGAPNVDAYWRNILNKVSTITDPPPEAWDTDVYYDPDFADKDKVYCKKGGYLGALASFDPLPHGIPPFSVGGEPDQWLALQLARDAMVDAGCTNLPEEIRQRTAVILGKGTYLNGGNALAVEHGLIIGQTLEIIKRLNPEFTGAQIELLRQEMKDILPPIGPETVPGLIPNIIVGRIANRLDLMGPTYTVDAACASSLVAVHQAMRDLRNGECDLALVGGAQVWMPVPALNVFCQLGALSRRQQIRPFDKDADGTILGEGIGMVVLKRLADAERDGNRIYAVIKGAGIASDGRGVSVMAPRVEGEALALERAYAAAGISPRSVGLIEAHGTATPVGDVVEVQALTRVFGRRDGELPTCALGTVKSMISHTIPAAGVAGLIKTALALYHKVLPPTLNCDKPNPKLELEKTPFYINTETRPWIHGESTPRRAGVNAFGFGGINAHVILEEYPGPQPVTLEARPSSGNRAASPALSHLPPWESEVCILEGATRGDLLEQANRLARFLDSALAGEYSAEPAFSLTDLAASLNQRLSQAGTNVRLALVATSVEDLWQKLSRAMKRLADPGCRRIKDVSGIYFNAEPLGQDSRLAFLFPGEGSQYPNMLADLCLHFPEVRECFDRSDRICAGNSRGYGLSDIVFPRPSFSDEQRQWAETRLMQMDSAVEAVLTGNLAMYALLKRLGLRPDVLVGHSTGEYSAMIAAGILDLDTEERLTSFSRSLNRYYQDSIAQDGVPRAMLLAIGADREQVAAIAREAGGEIYVAMDNCPHQAILVGTREAAERALEIVRREGLIYEQLAFDRAYHTQLFAPYADHLHQIMAQVPIRQPRVPIYSCTTAATYPTDPAGIRSLIVEHWARPVEFRHTIETLYKEGVRVFVEAGARGNLSAFVEDILRGQPYCAVPANVQRRSGIAQLNHLVGMLAAQGVNLDPSYLYERRNPQRIDWSATTNVSASPRSSEKMVLHMGWPLLKLPDDINQRLQPEGNGQPSPLAPLPILGEGPGVRAAPSAMEAYFQTMDQFLSTQEQIMQAYFSGPGDPIPEPEEGEPWWEYSVTVSGSGHAVGADAVGDSDTWALPEGDLARPGIGAGHERSVQEFAHETSAGPATYDRSLNGHSEAVAQPTTEPAPDTNGAIDSRARITTQLLDLVSERTGYPVEMLDPRLDLEADLGIDSIKRVEILGSYRQQVGNADGLNLEELTTQRTLEKIIDLLIAGSGEQAPTPNPSPNLRGGEPNVRARSPLPILGEAPYGPGVRAERSTPPHPSSRDYPLLGDVNI
ncbi:type I polyketide synthase, partial [Nitrolancea hollandica]|uniref:type I polyketide synthase n=1 Tax=Nitrolancea hollandica TaxID=1206749 RepID=UPI00135F169B